MICPRCQSTVVERVGGTRTAKCGTCGHSTHVTRFREATENRRLADPSDSPFAPLADLFPRSDYSDMEVEQPRDRFAKSQFLSGIKKTASHR